MQVINETAQRAWLLSRKRQVFAGNARFAEAACEVLGEGALADSRRAPQTR